MRKLLAVLCCLGMLALTSCSFIWPATSDEESSQASPNRVEYREEYEGKWCYQHLNNRLRECYEIIYTAVKDSYDRDEKIIIEDSAGGTSQEYLGIEVKLATPLMTRDDAQQLYTAFTWDNPQFFFIGNTYSYKGYRSEGLDYYNIFCLVFTMNAQQRKVAEKQLDAAVDSLLDGMPEETDEFSKELYLHDQLLNICTYDKQAAASTRPTEDYPDAFTAYGALVQGKGVCEGYSRAMQLLLHRVGIRATLVTGFDENQVSHMWNLVTIDGRNYHLDPTWNDADDLLRHTYFNLTTDEIELTHTLDGENIGVDSCTATESNYYKRMGTYLDTYKRDLIAGLVAEKMLAGETVIDLRFPPNKYESALSFISSSALYEKVNALLKKQGMQMNPQYNYQMQKNYCTITLYAETIK